MANDFAYDFRPATATSGKPDGTTGYIEYFQARRLHALQHPATDAPFEMAFLVSSQVMELYFGLLCHELGRAKLEVRHGDVPGAGRTLRRSLGHLRALEATWESYEDMAPSDWNPIKAHLGHGESSSVHSFMYRHLVFLLGLKSVQMLEPHESTPLIHQGLKEALHAPSIYDEILALLQLRGLAIPACVLERDFSEPYVPQREVEQAWLRVYREDSFADLRELGELLTKFAQHFNQWRQGHLTATVRTSGAKPGYYHTEAPVWLRRNNEQPIFAELWSARTAM
ncbi:tryptophan 2,3-dioxygenase [Streptomyces sp. NPDC101209]|uniref:tryptophan 2,3-dioxygenase n=1 Tax=Streptomyces sp. NPDC101209 TaxID=3366129 RepID=UPI0038003949